MIQAEEATHTAEKSNEPTYACRQVRGHKEGNNPLEALGLNGRIT